MAGLVQTKVFHRWKALLDPVTAIDEIFKETAGQYLEEAMDTTTTSCSESCRGSLNMDPLTTRSKVSTQLSSTIPGFATVFP